MASEHDRVNRLRNIGLAQRVAARLRREGPPAGRILDIGVASGQVTCEIQRILGRPILATDAGNYLDEGMETELEFELADVSSLPYRDESFSVVLLLSVYEHIDPNKTAPALKEIHRVLSPGGLLLGQVPNMNFPIEPHSRLPFVQFLPKSLEGWAYRHLSRVATAEHRAGGVNWYRFNRAELEADASTAGFRVGTFVHSEYDPALFPRPFRFATPILRVLPLGWDFWFRKS